MRSLEQLPVFIFRSMERKAQTRHSDQEVFGIQHFLQSRLYNETGTDSAAGADVRMECRDLQSCRLMLERTDQLLP